MNALNCENILRGFGRRRQGTPEETATVACVVRPAHRFRTGQSAQAGCCADLDSEEG